MTGPVVTDSMVLDVLHARPRAQTTRDVLAALLVDRTGREPANDDGDPRATWGAVWNVLSRLERIGKVRRARGSVPAAWILPPPVVPVPVTREDFLAGVGDMGERPF